MLEAYFRKFRKDVIGIDQTYVTPYGEKTIVYADWTASGRLCHSIERRMYEEVAPFVGNTHTESTVTGCTMTCAYHEALQLIKDHVGAGENDVIISSGSGMTGVINKFQRILGFRIHERFADRIRLTEDERPVIFCTHMEHHSNQTSWIESIADVVIIKPTDEGLVDLDHLRELLGTYAARKQKVAAITSCSNVTGIFTPYYEIAELMHQNGGFCFVDFACAAPYIDIDMHPEHPLQSLDAIYFSPHKFLGGPGSSGVLIFNANLYHNKIPDHPGGGTVNWTNPWGQHKYFDEIEVREDGGTPAFLQTIRVAQCIKLKEEMGTQKMLAREEEIMDILWEGLAQMPNLHILAGHIRERLGLISFYIDDLHYNLAVKILNDRFGIQARGGCSCAGTYGHYLLHVTPQYSKAITDLINVGDNSTKPGWIRLSIHPIMTNSEIHFIVDALRALCAHHREWGIDYFYNASENEFHFKGDSDMDLSRVRQWFDTPLIPEESKVPVKQ